ncbi:MAG: 3-dehydroquinate synthase, partial [Thermoanaerobaculia bacterium]|nr:3-dehydroquinate synthase [Thermoanaerobaculia bacterium]
LYGDELEPLLSLAAGSAVHRVPDGESAKSLEVAGEAWEWLVESGGKRDSRLLTLGGGSVGDLGGFLAGCFLRGIEYVQLPTTLLAQVDASIGGKTAIDLPSAKNSVGLFHHPVQVLADPSWLATLPAPELRSGLFEVVKMAFLLDPQLFERLEADLDSLLNGKAEAWTPIVAAAAAAKIGVVERDPEESGERKLLNFGHTLAHALETALGYSDLRHGEAVGWGMRLAVRLSETRGLDRSTGDRLERLIQRIGLPPLPSLSSGVLIDLMARDKKAREGGISWVLARDLGQGWVCDAGGVRGTATKPVGTGEVERELRGLLTEASH